MIKTRLDGTNHNVHVICNHNVLAFGCYNLLHWKAIILHQIGIHTILTETVILSEYFVTMWYLLSNYSLLVMYKAGLLLH